MKNNAQNAELPKTEEKVTAKSPAATAKKATPKTSRPKQAVVTKSAKKTATRKKVEKKNHKQKIIRDSFTMPENDYNILAALKKKCLAGGIAVKKSELLRAGLKSLAGMSQLALKKELSKLDEIKIGRPAKVSKGK